MPAVTMALTAAAMPTAPWVRVTDILLQPIRTTGNMPPGPGIVVTKAPGAPGTPATPATTAAVRVVGNLNR